MFRAHIQSPLVVSWSGRLRGVPRWGWVAVGVAMAVPLLVLLAAVAVFAAVAGAIVLTVVLGLLMVRNAVRRLSGARPTDMVRHDPFTERDVIVVERVDKQEPR